MEFNVWEAIGIFLVGISLGYNICYFIQISQGGEHQAKPAVSNFSKIDKRRESILKTDKGE